MDRHAARGLEALKVAQAMLGWLDELEANIGNGDAEIYVEPTKLTNVSGIGLTEAPRGALGHWLDVGPDGKLAHYQVISPTTWNCSPRDGKGLHGAMEEALLGIPIENADKPIEIMRVIHSFDPCLDCATHIIRPGKEAIVHRMGSC
jgi:Ni,Fe-hydrogenase I large subunit